MSHQFNNEVQYFGQISMFDVVLLLDVLEHLYEGTNPGKNVYKKNTTLLSSLVLSVQHWRLGHAFLDLPGDQGGLRAVHTRGGNRRDRR